jgi:hypothetical protein
LILKVNIGILFDGVPGNIVRGGTGLDVVMGQEDSGDVGFDHILQDFNSQCEFSDYYQPFHIQVPKATSRTRCPGIICTFTTNWSAGLQTNLALS